MSRRGIKHSIYVGELDKQAARPGADVRKAGYHGTGRWGDRTHGEYRQKMRKRCAEAAAAEERLTLEETKRAAEARRLKKEAGRIARWSADGARSMLYKDEAALKRARALEMSAEKRRTAGADAMGEGVRMRSYSVSSYTYVPPKREPDEQARALEAKLRQSERNFMDGVSYRINPVDTLKMMTASSVFGEPQYYRGGDRAQAAMLDGVYGIDRVFAEHSLKEMDPFRGMTTSQVMEKAIDEALDADFGAVLDWAAELRDRYMMRLNPQVILVRAAVHPGRAAFTKANPGVFSEIAQKVMARGDDVSAQIEYWLAANGSKQGIPAVLKRAWARRIGGMDAYSMAKYGAAGIGLVDAVRICHAKGRLVDELMRSGRVAMPEGEDTWERMRASGMKWEEILASIRMPHMALLRNLRGIFSEVRDDGVRENALEALKRGVKKGRQFPFRYLSAWKAADAEGRPWAGQVKKALEECINISVRALPELPGRCAFLSDNSGSAWGACTSEWGTMKVAEIGNLSSVIGAMCAEEGMVFPFGDRLQAVPVRKDEGVLEQAARVNSVGGDCGMATENGVWLFFRDAIMQRQMWDSIFIYSDMQAGHGGLYGVHPEDYEALGCSVNGRYIDVNALVEIYRREVNPRVNVYCIQTAGYTNVLAPEYGYRTSILYGWTGRELIFADAMRRTWDGIESRQDRLPAV